MKILRISGLLLILAVVLVSGCKVAKTITEEAAVESSEEVVVNDGLQELEEIDSLEEETDLGLDEIEKMELE